MYCNWDGPKKGIDEGLMDEKTFLEEMYAIMDGKLNITENEPSNPKMTIDGQPTTITPICDITPIRTPIRTPPEDSQFKKLWNNIDVQLRKIFLIFKIVKNKREYDEIKTDKERKDKFETELSNKKIYCWFYILLFIRKINRLTTDITNWKQMIIDKCVTQHRVPNDDFQLCIYQHNKYIFMCHILKKILEINHTIKHLYGSIYNNIIDQDPYIGTDPTTHHFTKDPSKYKKWKMMESVSSSIIDDISVETMRDNPNKHDDIYWRLQHDLKSNLFYDENKNKFTVKYGMLYDLSKKTYYNKQYNLLFISQKDNILYTEDSQYGYDYKNKKLVELKEGQYIDSSKKKDGFSYLFSHVT